MSNTTAQRKTGYMAYNNPNIKSDVFAQSKICSDQYSFQKPSQIEQNLIIVF